MSLQAIRVLFLGTAEVSATSLEAVAAMAGVEIACVVCQPDRPIRRSKTPQAPLLKQCVAALGLNCPVLQPPRCREPEAVAEIAACGPFDVGVVVAYGQIIPQALLDLPRHGCLNLHTSLLPRYRGAAPVQHALLNGDSQVGVSIQRMVMQLDAGPVVAQQVVEVREHESCGGLLGRLAEVGSALLVETLPAYVAGATVEQPQDPALVTLAPKLTKADGQIDWSRCAQTFCNHVRAMTPWPGAFCFVRTRSDRPPQRLVVLAAQVADRAPPTSMDGTVSMAGTVPTPGTVVAATQLGIEVACGGGESVLLTQLQPSGRSAMAAADWWRGCHGAVGERFVGGSHASNAS